MKIVLDKILKELMAKKGVSARAVCKATGIAQSTFAGLLDSNREPSVKFIPVLAEYFGVTTDYLLTGIKTENQRLEELLTEQVFDGYLKVRIERVIKRKSEIT